MKAATAALGMLLIFGSLALAGQSASSSHKPSGKPKATSHAGTRVRTGAPATRHDASKPTATSGTSHAGNPVRTGAPATRHDTSKPTGTSGTSHVGNPVKTGAPATRHETSTSHGKKHSTRHKKATATPPSPER